MTQEPSQSYLPIESLQAAILIGALAASQKDQQKQNGMSIHQVFSEAKTEGW